MACECCGRKVSLPMVSKYFGPGADCSCMNAPLCKACNHCVDHCKCPLPDVDLPCPMQVGEIREYWRKQGVAV